MLQLCRRSVGVAESKGFLVDRRTLVTVGALSAQFPDGPVAVMRAYLAHLGINEGVIIDFGTESGKMFNRAGTNATRCTGYQTGLACQICWGCV